MFVSSAISNSILLVNISLYTNTFLSFSLLQHALILFVLGISLTVCFMLLKSSIELSKTKGLTKIVKWGNNS